ncbi:beta-lactamase/transpeptidase-like protein [Cylindrobasidium torrendii FP15055 ss-10]|uniref:Beta-lactamase/transpeptidase-like protein n=1 Tax=Cylindrobasidium torrendii FP15055 ss-10 TaxID=1314674 RepID=A0A0D7BHP7_9AGAR|nr:beta-lactamase/transpeptidase-like protein [Cylindrobasidium torrendii FP15055 ss-10]
MILPWSLALLASVRLSRALISIRTPQAQISRATNDSLILPSIDEYIHEVLEASGSPGGLGVAVVSKSTDGTWSVETKGYGNATSNGTSVDDNTVFAIGSNSKLFAALSVGLLATNESISLSSKMSSILPGWGLMDEEASNHATLVDLLSHRTGLASHDLMYNTNDTVPDIIARTKYLKPSASFRDIFQYTNVMYMLASYLPTAALGIPYAHYVKEHILDPLGLHATTFSTDVASSGHILAQGFAAPGLGMTEQPALELWTGDVTGDGDLFSGPGGVLMNARDAAVWLQTLLLKGAHPRTGEQVIPAEIFDFVTNGVTVISTIGTPIVYGAGQYMYSYNGAAVVEHDGGVAGFRSLVSRMPDLGVGVAVFSNDEVNGGDLMSLVRTRVYDTVLDIASAVDSSLTDTTGASNSSADSSTTPLVTPKPPSIDAAQHAGLYVDGAYGAWDFCYISNISSCDEISDIPQYFWNTSTGADILSKPNLVAQIDKLGGTHILLSHFDADVWNATFFLLPSYVDASGKPTGERWIRVAATATATFNLSGSSIMGFGLTGVWGAGHDAASLEPVEGDVKASSEVYFGKQ